jgi:hypothetical protein
MQVKQKRKVFLWVHTGFENRNFNSIEEVILFRLGDPFQTSEGDILPLLFHCQPIGYTFVTINIENDVNK